MTKLPENQFDLNMGKTILNPKEWVKQYADYLFKFAVLRVRDEQIAQDLVQDTFLSALKAIEKFKGNSTERTWLTGILKHKIIDNYRKQSASLQSINSDKTIEEVFFETENGHWKKEHAPQQFAEPMQEKEFDAVLKACMQKLPKLWASVFLMKHIDEEETAVILSELRLTSANFWVIIHRTKLNLRACLQKNWL